ncbi:MAG TPA: GAF domain-containing sensor histidine kinase [Gaiellaceae bacterium]|nr:GAF domain-containing sensor histidine kinase [Gaiellaceae bacterium]
MRTEQERLRAVVEAGIALTSELSLDTLLQRIVETASRLTGARYAALGVLDAGRVSLERFVYTGIDDEMRARIGDLPRGRGILGALIEDAKPLRLHAIADDPRSVGFPEHHPPMQTFLGVPVTIRGIAYGNLYLTEKEGGEDFTDEDEDVALLLAAQAGTAIENARLYESATRWSRQLETLNEIIAAMASEVELPRLLNLVAARLREVVNARLVTIALPTEGKDLRVEAADGEGAAVLLGARLGHDSSKHARVLERGRTERVDSFLDDPEVDQALTRQAGLRSGLYVPLTIGERRIGVVAAHDKLTTDGRFTDADVRLSEIFAARAAVAVDLSRRVAQDALERAIAAQETERRRLALELHDETGQELTSILLGLRGVEEAQTDEERASAIAEVRALAVQTLQNVRRLAVELRPKALDDFGLVPALERLAESFGERTGMKVEVESAGLDARLPELVETTLYRVVQEALTNVVKHAQAGHVSIVLARRGSAATAVVEDDGRGFDPASENGGIGLAGMRERLALIGGRLEVESGPGVGTTIVAEAPLP